MEQMYIAEKAFIIDEYERLLVIKKGQKDLLNPNKDEVPGGKFEFGEDPEICLKREVFEEVGINIVVGDPFATWQWCFTKKDDKNQDIDVQIVAIGRICATKDTNIDFSNQTSTDSIVEAEWVPISQLGEYDFIPNMLPAINEFIKLYKKHQENKGGYDRFAQVIEKLEQNKRTTK